MKISRLKDRFIHGVLRRPTPEQKFFSKTLDHRIDEVTSLYSDKKKRERMKGYFDRTPEQIRNEMQHNFRLFYDFLLGYSQMTNPQATMQLGCFVATELQWLRHNGLGGRLVAADHSKDYLRFLESGFSKTAFSGFEFRSFNLDRPRPENFAGIEMVTAMAVLSNVQPESMDALFASMSSAGVRIVLVGDMYVAQSLSGNTDSLRSYPLTGSRNWAHPYRALGRKHGYDAVFIPDFTYSSFKEARGIFALTQGFDAAATRAAAGHAMDHYLARQDECWDAFETSSAGR